MAKVDWPRVSQVSALKVQFTGEMRQSDGTETRPQLHDLEHKFNLQITQVPFL